jgi:hypothetical protein
LVRLLPDKPGKDGLFPIKKPRSWSHKIKTPHFHLKPGNNWCLMVSCQIRKKTEKIFLLKKTK